MSDNDINPLIDEAMLPAARWDILRTLRIGGHLGATERMIREVLVAGYLGITQHWLRDQLTYLEDRKLVAIERHAIDPWRVTLTRHGYDVADYQVPCEAGIRRPPRAILSLFESFGDSQEGANHGSRWMLDKEASIYGETLFYGFA